MRLVLLTIAIALTIALYRMLSRGGKNYIFNRIQTTNFMPDGSERVSEEEQTGQVIITNKMVIIDGIEYCYKPLGDEQLQAILDYENNKLKFIRVLLPDAIRQYFIVKG